MAQTINDEVDADRIERIELESPGMQSRCGPLRLGDPVSHTADHVETHLGNILEFGLVRDGKQSRLAARTPSGWFLVSELFWCPTEAEQRSARDVIRRRHGLPPLAEWEPIWNARQANFQSSLQGVSDEQPVFS